MRSLATLAVVVGFLVQFIALGALAAGDAASVLTDADSAIASRVESALQTPASLEFAKRACRRRAALKIRNFVKEQLSPLPRPIGYLVSKVGVTRWLQSLQLVPAMAANNAGVIQTRAPFLASLLSSYGSGSVVDGLTQLVEKVGAPDSAVPDQSLLAFLDLGGEHAKLGVDVCVTQYRLTTTPLQREACSAYESTGEAGLKMLAIKLFTNTLHDSPIGHFAVQYGGLHGLGSRGEEFVSRLSAIVANTRLGALMSRAGGFSRILSDVQQGAHGLESIAWSLFGPKLWEKASHCAGGDGAQYAPPRMWKALSKLTRDTPFVDSFPASGHYTYQFWIKPTQRFTATGNVFRHGASTAVSAPSVSTCAAGNGAAGLAVSVAGRNGTHGITCSSPLPANACTFVSVVNRGGDLRLYFNDALVNKALIPGQLAAEGPVYFSDPWTQAAAADVMPVSVLSRAVTASEIARSIGATQHVCANSFAAPLRSRFAAVRDAERAALSEIASSVHSNIEAASKADAVTDSNTGAELTSAQSAEIEAAQHEACLFRFRSLSVRKLAQALAKSPIAAVFNQHGGTLRSFLEAGAAGKFEPLPLDKELAPTHIGSALARVGGLKALVAAAASGTAVVDTATKTGWVKVQDLIFQMGGGKLELALERCAKRVDVSASQALEKQACDVVHRWGRASLPAYAVKLFENAVASSRVGHLYKHYGSFLGFATAMRSNQELEGKIVLLFAGSEAGQILAKHGGLSAAFTAAMQGPTALNAFVWTAFAEKINAVTASCGNPSDADVVRNTCRQRIIRRAAHEFAASLKTSPLGTVLPQFTVVAGNGSEASVAMLAGVPVNRIYMLDDRIAGTTLARQLAPLGGVAALADAARSSQVALQNFVWKLHKLDLIPEVNKCTKRSERQAAYVEQCRKRVRDFYQGRFTAEVNGSPLQSFASKFGGFTGLARHDSGLLVRLSSLIEQHPIAERFRPLGGLIVVLETIKQDKQAFDYLLTDMYGATAQAALNHCDVQAPDAALASTATFMVSLKEKLNNPAFKRILDRALLAASHPIAQSSAALELAKLGGLQGLILAASEGNDDDVAAFVAERLGSPIDQSAIGPYVKKMGMADGLRRLVGAQHAAISAATADLQCQILSSTWLKRSLEELGGCEAIVPLTGRVDALEELSQAKVQKMFVDTGLNFVFGEPRGFELALMNGEFEPVLRKSIVATFSAQHGQAHATHFAEMFSKILGKMESHSQTAAAQKSFLEAGAGTTTTASAGLGAGFSIGANGAVKMRDSADDFTSPLPMGIDLTGVPAGEVIGLDAGGAPPVKTPGGSPDGSVDLAAVVNGTTANVSEAQMPTIQERVEKEINNVPARCPNQCSSRGKCVQNTGKTLLAGSGNAYIHPYECICDPGWTGTGCEIYIDQYVRWLLSKGRFQMPKCCPTCSTQTNPLPESRWVPAASASQFPVDPRCAHPEWISDRQKRANCIRSVLATRQRVVPSPSITTTTAESSMDPVGDAQEAARKKKALAGGFQAVFLETGMSVTASGSNDPSMDAAASKKLFENYASHTNADLNAVEAAFDAEFSQTVRSHAEALAAEQRQRQSLVEESNGPQPRAGSAAAMFPEKTAAQLRADAEGRYTSMWNKAYSLVEGSTGPQPGVTTVGELSAEAKPMTVTTTGLIHDTSHLFTPEPLDEIHVPDCCIPCDAHPHKDIAPKFVPAPDRDRGILERLAENPNLPHSKAPYEKSVATKMIEGVSDGAPYSRRGPVERLNSFAYRASQSTHDRRSNHPLPSEIIVAKQKEEEESCCTICPFKHVRAIFQKTHDEESEDSSPATFLELDAAFLRRSEDRMYAFIEQSLSVVLRSGAEADADVEDEYELDPDAQEPAQSPTLESIVGASRRMPVFPKLETEDAPAVAVKVARAARNKPFSLLEVSASTAPFPANPDEPTTEQKAEMLVQRHKIMALINETKDAIQCDNKTGKAKRRYYPSDNSTQSRLSRMDIWLRAEATNSTVSAQAQLSDWLSKLERKRTQTMPPKPATAGTDFTTGVNHDNVPFVPRPDKRAAPCCDICPSVFVLRQFPHNPWEEGPGPAFEVLN